MPFIDADCGLLESRWEDFVADLVIIVAAADSAPSQNHSHDLSDLTIALVLELVVD